MMDDVQLSTPIENIKMEVYPHNSEPNNCIFCPSKIFPELHTALKLHSYASEFCQYCSIISSKLFDQISNQENETYFCSYCTIGELGFNELSIHLVRHYAKEQCVCPGESVKEEIENNEFNKESLTLISEEMSTICEKKTRAYTAKEKEYHCEYCYYQTNHDRFLASHMLRHTGDRTFQCTFCEYKSRTNTQLKSHVRGIHKRDKPFQCKECEFKTSHSSSLRSHSKIHTGERPFHCNFCEVKCLTKYGLKKHMLVHTGKKKFKCDQCGFKTKVHSHLTKHIKRHTGEQPFQCDKCEFKTAFRLNLKRHFISFHKGEKPFHCNYCNYKSSLKESLKLHLEVHVKGRVRKRRTNQKWIQMDLEVINEDKNQIDKQKN